jgi:hypothetical protein
VGNFHRPGERERDELAWALVLSHYLDGHPVELLSAAGGSRRHTSVQGHRGQALILAPSGHVLQNEPCRVVLLRRGRQHPSGQGKAGDVHGDGPFSPLGPPVGAAAPMEGGTTVGSPSGQASAHHDRRGQ